MTRLCGRAPCRFRCCRTCLPLKLAAHNDIKEIGERRYNKLKGAEEGSAPDVRKQATRFRRRFRIVGIVRGGIANPPRGELSSAVLVTRSGVFGADRGGPDRFHLSAG